MKRYRLKNNANKSGDKADNPYELWFQFKRKY